MTERDATTHRDQIGLLGRRGCLDRNAKGAGGAPEQHWIAERLGRADQQQSLRLLGELCHLAAKLASIRPASAVPSEMAKPPAKPARESA